MSQVVQKPWGHYTDHYRTKTLVFKTLVINPGEQISYQFHHQRNEVWYISSGMGIIKIDGIEQPTIPTDVHTILIKQHHGIRNNGTDPLVIHEMQIGICLEDDIVRLEDPYNR